MLPLLRWIAAVLTILAVVILFMRIFNLEVERTYDARRRSDKMVPRSESDRAAERGSTQTSYPSEEGVTNADAESILD